MTINHESGPLFEQGDKSNGIVFLTNRFNLLEILSARYIAPKESYTKYYADLLAFGRGRIPLLRAPLSEELLALVKREGEASFPVALEIDEDQFVDSKLPSLKQDGSSSNSSLREERAIAWAPSGLLPLSAVRRIIFQSQTDLAEHSARSYENIPKSGLPLVVQGGLFTGGTFAAEKCVAWLKGLPEDGLEAKAYTSGDRLSGARCLAAVSLPRAPSAATIVLQLLRSPVGKSPPESDSPRELPVAPWIGGLVAPSQRRGATELNTRLFVAAAQVFQAVDRQAEWRPAELLSQIEALVRAKKLNKKDTSDVARNFEPIRGILRNEREFKSFMPGVGLDAAKAILMVLLRPEAEHLLAWPQDETGADDSVVITAAVLCGLLNGRERLPVRLRPESLDRYLAFTTALELSTGKDSIGLTLGEEPNTLSLVKTPPGGKAGSVSLVWQGETLITWEERPKGAKEIFAELDLGNAETERVAIDLCRKLLWNECVQTQIIVEAAEVSVSSPSKGKTVVAFRGLPLSTTHALDHKAFKTRLGNTPIPQQYEDELTTYIVKQAGR